MVKISRRSLIASLAALPLAGCLSGEKVKIRYRVIAWLEVDGKPFQASTVMEVHYARVTNSLTGAGGATRLYGEALIADIPGKGTFYIMPVKHEQGGTLAQFWETAILLTLGTKSSIGMLKPEDFELMRAASGQMKVKTFRGSEHPAFVSFGDESKPKTIFEIQPDRLDEVFPGVRFIGLDILITDAPISKMLRDRLPWLNTPVGQEVFERDPPGKQRPYWEKPLGLKVTKAHFFGDGSR
ncbi:hypothetical protein CO659_21160 [Rhizobium sp. S9]|uniref:hypothetical protein n=1 Tax=unclassified Rhizobium TaxID=2613769 RepID=UPI000A27220D|nr:MULTISPECIES: hypothetical protein [unclassified Rhizobium]PDS96020.1 hypothetical protein CO659_21160 [Rhizobium sp. S9]